MYGNLLKEKLPGEISRLDCLLLESLLSFLMRRLKKCAQKEYVHLVRIVRKKGFFDGSFFGLQFDSE